MYKEVSLSDFQENTYLNNCFSTDSIKIIFDVLQLEERELGYEYKFDAVWITCSFAEYKEDELLEEYDVENIDQMADYQIIEVPPNNYRDETKKTYIVRL